MSSDSTSGGTGGLLSSLFAGLVERGCVACGQGVAVEWGARLCSACAEEIPPGLSRLQADPSVQGGWALGPYAGPAGALMRHAKYGRDEGALRVMAEALADRWVRRLGVGLERARVGLVVPVPGDRWRTLWRGMDPVKILAQRVAARSGLPLWPVLRRSGGASQAGLSPEARRRNLRGHIRARGPLPPDARVLLVDDVLTTGATAQACADELLGAGAAEVWLLAVCSAGERISG